MDDVTLSIWILLGAAVFCGGILLFTRYATRKRDLALAAYCAAQGYLLESKREGTARSLQISAPDWQLLSSMRSERDAGQTGSSDWQRQTQWICQRKDERRPTFALQLSSGSTNLSKLPTYVRDAAIQAMRLWLGEDMPEITSARTAFCEGGRCCAVYETVEHNADEALERLRAPLLALHGSLPLYVLCSPERLCLSLPGAALWSTGEIIALLKVGFAMLEAPKAE